MKRRGFFGIVGGAAIAGPSIAKEVVSQLPSGLGNASIPMPPMGYLGQGIVNSTADSGSWKLAEIASIKRFLTGELTDEEKEGRNRQRLYRREQVINQNVACLQSVSGSRKLAIYGRRMELHGEEMDRSERQQRLHWLLRQE